jgi:anti-sigma regulatory factor (Ser/Thr protein kinase)
MKTVEDEISSTLEGIVSPTTRRSLFNRLGGLATTPIHQLSRTDRRLILLELEASMRLFAPEESPRVLAHCTRILDQPVEDFRPLAPSPLAATFREPASPSLPAFPTPPRFAVAQIEDMSRVRLETWAEAVRLGFSKDAAIQIASTAAELARIIVAVAGRGTIELLAEREVQGTWQLDVVAQDDGPGIPPETLRALTREGGTTSSGSARGGRGLGAVRRLAGNLRIDSRPGSGTTVSCRFRQRQSLAVPPELAEAHAANRSL